MRFEICVEHLLIIVLLFILLKNFWVRYRAQRDNQKKKGKKKGLPRKWKSRNPKHCPACRAGICLPALHPRREVTTWKDVRSRRGRKKRIQTEGHCCLNPFCWYFGITDAAVHALVGNGTQGPNKIQLLRCQACGRGFTSRRNTPLYYLKTCVERIEMCLWLLAEGVDIAVLVRFTHHVDATISRWLERAGRHSEKLHQQMFVNLDLAYVQIDELKAPLVGDKENWLWAAIEALSKIMPAIHVGKRSNDDAMVFIHRLVLCLAPGCVPAFTSDGIRQYFYALTAHFGHWRWPNNHRASQSHCSPRRSTAQTPYLVESPLCRSSLPPRAVVEMLLSLLQRARIAEGARPGLEAPLPGSFASDGGWSHRPSVVGGRHPPPACGCNRRRCLLRKQLPD